MTVHCLTGEIRVLLCTVYCILYKYYYTACGHLDGIQFVYVYKHTHIIMQANNYKLQIYLYAYTHYLIHFEIILCTYNYI